MIFQYSLETTIKGYIVKKASEYFFSELKSRVTIFIKELDREQIQKISIIAISTIGMVVAAFQKRIFFSIFFFSILVLEIKNYFYFEDHKQAKAKIKELETKSNYDEKIITTLQKNIKQLEVVNSIIPKLEEKLNLFEETHKDVNRAIDLLIEVKEENKDLKNRLSKDANKIALHSEKIETSSKSLEKSAEKIEKIAKDFINRNHHQDQGICMKK